MRTRQANNIGSAFLRRGGKVEKQKAIYNTCKLAYDQTWDRLTALDKKAQMFLAVSVLQVTGLGFVINYICSKSIEFCYVDMLLIILLLFSVVTCMSGILLFVYVLKIRDDIRSYTNPHVIIKEFSQESLEELFESLADRLADDRKVNEGICTTKAARISNGTICIVVSFILLGLMLSLLILREGFGIQL